MFTGFRRLDTLGNRERSLALETRLSLLVDEEQKLLLLRNCLRFSPVYFGYRSNFFWKAMDGVALYFHLLMYFVLLLLNSFWWFNLTNIVQFSVLVVLNIKIGRSIHG